MRIAKIGLFLIACVSTMGSMQAATTVTADFIKPSGTGTKTSFTKSVAITKDLTTTGNTTNNGTLSVAGATKLNGGLTMDTNKFVVANATGNTTIGGTLSVAGVTKLNGGLTMDTNKFVVANGTGDTTIGGALYVVGEASEGPHEFTVDVDGISLNNDTTIAGALNVSGSITGGSFTITNLNVDGIAPASKTATSFSGDVSIDGGKNLTIDGGSLSVTGTANLYGNAFMTSDNPATLTSTGLAAAESQPVSVAFSPAGDFVAVVNNSNTHVKIFSVNTSGNLSSVISQSTDSGSYSVAWSPNWSPISGGFVATLEGNSVKVFSVDVGGHISSSEINSQTTGTSPMSVAWSPQGNFIAVTNYIGNSVQIFSVDASGTLSSVVSSKTTGSYPTSVAWAPNWSSETGGFIAVTSDGSDHVQIFRVNQSGSISSALSSASFLGTPWSASFSPNWSSVSGGYLAVSSNNMVKIFSVDTSGNLTYVSLDGIGLSPLSVAWSPLGNFIALTCAGNDDVRIYSVDASGNLPELGGGGRVDSGFYTSQATGSYPTSVAFSPLGNVIAVTNQNDNTVQTFTANFLGYQISVGKDRITLNNDTIIRGDTTIDGNALIGGLFDIVGTTTGGHWHNIKGEKTINSIGTAETNALTLTFADVAGATAPLKKGAVVRLYCLISGTISETNSINLYKGELLILPGATSGSSCARVVVSEGTTNGLGSATTVTSSVSGTGTSATIQLTSSATMSTQSVDIFYEIMSSNLTSVS